jgi:protein SCO1/2
MKKYLFLIQGILLISGCGNHFNLNENVTDKNLTLINQDSIKVNYPEIIKNKIAVIGFIYTHCPDICPLTTHNMQLVEEKLSTDELNKVKFYLISFDPERDTPSILKQYAEVRNINMTHWELLTGDKNAIDTLLNEFNVKAIHDDTVYKKQGQPEYFIIHTDRISLVDEDGILRKNYKGSTAKPEELVNDIKYLE